MQVTTILGSNSGQKQEIMAHAIRLLECAGRVIARSSLYETAPWGFECKEIFLNQLVVFETALSPKDFLIHCLQTEKQLGRVRISKGERYSSRPIDIDILFCESLHLDTPELTVPHPRLAERNFVLIPLREVMPDFIHPVLHQTITELCDSCPDTLAVKKLQL